MKNRAIKHTFFYKRILFYLPLLLLGAESLFHLLQVVAGRIHYPYELEWMEGGVLHQVLRVLHGEPLYAQPSLDFVPALYMPLYYYLSALSALIFGENLFALRVVSVIATLATHTLVFLIVRRVSGSLLAAVLGVLLFASTFPHTAFWFDVGRVDSVWTCFLAATLYALLRVRDKPSLCNISIMAVFSVAAFCSKQASLFIVPFFVLAMLCWTDWRKTAFFCLIFSAGCLFFVALLQLPTESSFFFYAFEMASTHGVTLFGFKRFGLDILFSIVFMLLAACLYPWLVQERFRDKLGWLAILLGFIFLSMLSRAYAGAFFNVLMPLHFCTAVLAALAFSLLVERSLAQKWMVIPSVLMLVAFTAEMYRHRYEPEDQLPTKASLMEYEGLVRRIAAVNGNVCVTSHGYLAWLAGKGFCAHNTQVTDLMTGSDPVLAQVLRDDAQQKILAGYYSVIVLDREKELLDLGLQFSDIPYTVTPIEYQQGPIEFPVNGYSPKLWLEFKKER